MKTERLQEYGEFTASGRVMMRDVLKQVWSEVNEKHGIDAKLPPPPSGD